MRNVRDATKSRPDFANNPSAFQALGAYVKQHLSFFSVMTAESGTTYELETTNEQTPCDESNATAMDIPCEDVRGCIKLRTADHCSLMEYSGSSLKVLPSSSWLV